MAAPDVFKSTIFERFFGAFDKRIDTNKDVNGKGTHERTQEAVGDLIDQELWPLIKEFLPNTIEPQTLFEELIPHAEHLLGYDRKNKTLQLGETPEWHRRILAHMIRYYHIKGTKRCYELLFEIMGLTVTIEEFWPENTFDSSDPDITFDTDDRPRLDYGKCTPCSRYEVTVIGGPPWDEISVGVLSIIVFNEPINAYRGLLTYNGQEIDVTEGPQGDPCPLIDYDQDVVNTDNDANTFEVEVTLAGTQPADFTLGTAYYTVNNGAPVDIIGLALGTPYNLGVTFNEGDEIRVVINNTERPLCVVHLAMVTWLSPCEYPSDVQVVPFTPSVQIWIPDSALPLPSGFAVTSLRYSLNGLPQIEIPFTEGDAGAITIGPFYEGGTLQIWLNNDINELCNYYVGEFELEPSPVNAPFEMYEYIYDCFSLTPTTTWELTMYDAFPGGAPFEPGMLRYRIDGGSWIDYGVVAWGDVVSIAGIPSPSLVDIDFENLANIDNPYVIDAQLVECPCQNTNKFPNDEPGNPQVDAVDADFVFLPANQAAAVASTIPIGSKVFIYDADSTTPGDTTLWEQNIGNMFERTAMDHLDSDFTLQVLPVGTVVRDLQAVDTPYEYYMTDKQNPGLGGYYEGGALSGKWSYQYLRGVLPLAGSPPGTNSTEGPTPVNLGFAMGWNDGDQCRWFLLQVTDSVDIYDPGAVWVDSPLMEGIGGGGAGNPSDAPYVGSFTEDYPPGTTGVRLAWYRGPNFQGYSQPIPT